MTKECISPLRRRMIEDMTVRRLASETQRNYIRAVKTFACYLGRSPETATAEDLRLFQLHLSETHVRPPTINATVTALRFLFTVTLDRAEVARRLTFVHEPRKLPVVSAPRRLRACWMRRRASSTRPRSASPMAPACASPKWSRSKSRISTASA